MSGVEIYMEGGGHSRDDKATLRQGMDALLQPLKDAARAKALHWKLVPCGARNEAFRRFRNEVGKGDDAIIVLLVDTEGPLPADSGPRQHLQSPSRDGWDMQFADEDMIHLMVQSMETWIVADPDALSTYYGQNFNRNALPKRENLEMEPKADVARALNQATERTTKRRYHKIKHASDLLKRINVEKVKNRCLHCARLFDVIGRMIDAA